MPTFFFQIFFLKKKYFSKNVRDFPMVRNRCQEDVLRAPQEGQRKLSKFYITRISSRCSRAQAANQVSLGIWDQFGRGQRRYRQRNRFQILGNQIRMQRNRFPNLGQTQVFKGFYTPKNVVPFSRDRQLISVSKWSDRCPKRGSALDVDLALNLTMSVHRDSWSAP